MSVPVRTTTAPSVEKVAMPSVCPEVGAVSPVVWGLSGIQGGYDPWQVVCLAGAWPEQPMS